MTIPQRPLRGLEMVYFQTSAPTTWSSYTLRNLSEATSQCASLRSVIWCTVDLSWIHSCLHWIVLGWVNLHTNGEFSCIWSIWFEISWLYLIISVTIIGVGSTSFAINSGYWSDLLVPSAGNIESLQQILGTAASFNQRIAILQAAGTAVPEFYPFLFPSNSRNQAPVLKEIGVVGKAVYKLLKKAAEGGVVCLPKTNCRHKCENQFQNIFQAWNSCTQIRSCVAEDNLNRVSIWSDVRSA